MFNNHKLKKELKNQELALKEANETISVIGKENKQMARKIKDLELELKIAKMYVNDNEAIMELLEVHESNEKAKEGVNVATWFREDIQSKLARQQAMAARESGMSRGASDLVLLGHLGFSNL
jgi:hypothetical protein